MKPSSTYITVQKMIQHGLLVVIFPQFAQTLALLEERGLFTAAEHSDLLQLAEQITIDTLIH